jgi:hypothetical protein
MDATFGQLLQAIPEVGFLDPIGIYDRYDGMSVGNGHHRLTAAILLGLDEIPVVRKAVPISGKGHRADLHRYDEITDFRHDVADSLDNDRWRAQDQEYAEMNSIPA